MPAAAFALALGAAVLHATWNALLAGADDVRAAASVALGVAVVLFAPLAVATWDVDSEAVPWIVASAALELVYFVLLTTAYRRSDLSLVYPIARGSAPVLVLGGAAVVGVAVGAVQAIGVILVGLGVVLVRGLRRVLSVRGGGCQGTCRNGKRTASQRAQHQTTSKRGHPFLPLNLRHGLLPCVRELLANYVTIRICTRLRGKLGKTTIWSMP